MPLFTYRKVLEPAYEKGTIKNIGNAHDIFSKILINKKIRQSLNPDNSEYLRLYCKWKIRLYCKWKISVLNIPVNEDEMMLLMTESATATLWIKVPLRISEMLMIFVQKSEIFKNSVYSYPDDTGCLRIYTIKKHFCNEHEQSVNE